jgi:curli biogenesis system outer membrane secretion channel CsgG
MKVLSAYAFVIGLLAGGCAFTDATLRVRYDEAATGRGPLSAVEPRRVEISPFTDKRPEIDKIGNKKNAFGQKTAKIFAERPVTDIVRDALVAEFAKNGHRLDGSPQFKVAGEVTTFWFNTNIGAFTVEFVGTVGVALNVVDTRTGATVLSRPYQGNYNERSMGGLDETWERVLNTALERMVQQVVTDPRLVEALRGQP